MTKTTSVRFTEEMKGHVTFGETDFDAGAEKDRPNSHFLMFHLTIEIPDLDAFAADPLRRGSATGWVRCDRWTGDLPVELGDFNLFIDQETKRSKRMRYRLWFRDPGGAPLTLAGFKVVRDDPGFDVWSDTTRLYTRLLEGHVESAAAFPPSDVPDGIIASGIITIWTRDFLRQLTTFRAGGPNLIARARAVLRFGRIFVKQLVTVYLPRSNRS